MTNNRLFLVFKSFSSASNCFGLTWRALLILFRSLPPRRGATRPASVGASQGVGNGRQRSAVDLGKIIHGHEHKLKNIIFRFYLRVKARIELKIYTSCVMMKWWMEFPCLSKLDTNWSVVVYCIDVQLQLSPSNATGFWKTIALILMPYIEESNPPKAM